MADAIVTLRPLLQLALLVAIIRLAARVLRQVLLGRVGQFGKLLLIAVLVGSYALTVLLTAMGAPPPWMPFMFVALGSKTTVLSLIHI